MKITINDRGTAVLRERLRDRLDTAAGIRCSQHGEAAVSVVINGRENGWFDSNWTACCEEMERQLSDILKHRC